MGPVRKFQFSLQTALDLRRREEEAAQQRLAEAQRAAEGLRAHLRDTEARYAEVVASVRRGIAGLCPSPPTLTGGRGRGPAPAGSRATVELAHVARAEDYLFRLKDLIDLQRQRLQQAEQVSEQRRQEALTAAQRHKSLQRLRERQEKQHRREALAQEARWLDEVAVTSFPGGRSRRADRAA